MNGAALAVAGIAAVSFGWSTALMHHSASRAPQKGREFVGLIRYLLTQPRWLIGITASLIGLGLHAWALRLGAIAVVQPIVVTGLVFAFLFRALLDRQWPSLTLVAWVAVTAAGIAVFLIGAQSTSSSKKPSGHAATAFVLSGAVVIVAAVLLSRRTEGRPNRAGFLLGVGGGVVFGMIAGVLKAVTDSGSLHVLFTHWPLYVLVILGATGFSINQLAYAAASLASSLPVLNVINPIVAVGFGFAVFDERPSSEPVMVGFEVVGLLLVLTGVAALAIAEERSPDRVPLDL